MGTATTSLRDLAEETRVWLAARVGTFFVRTLNQGLGWFFAFALALTGSAVALRAARIGWQDDQAVVNQWMKFKLQPASETTNAAVIGLLLSELQQAKFVSLLSCPNTQTNDCRFADELWIMTQRLIDAAEFTPENNLAGYQLQVSPSWQGENPRAAVTQLLSSREGARAPMPPAQSHSCGDNEKVKRRREMFNLADPICSLPAATLTAEIVPQQSAGAVSDAALNPARVNSARFDGQLFDLAVTGLVSALQAKAGCGTSCDRSRGPVVVQAYFLSVDSVMRIWRRARPVSASDLSSHRLWAARPYFERAITELPAGGTTVTLPYIDFAGNGIVQTECRLMTAPRPKPADGSSDRLSGEPRYAVGTVCVDFALSEGDLPALVHAVDKSPLADAALVTFAQGLGGEWGPLDQQFPAWLKSAIDLPAVQAFRERLASDPSVRRDVLTIWEPHAATSEPVYLLPVAAFSEGSFSTVFIRVTAIGLFGTRPLTMFAVVVAIALAGIAGLTGARSSKKLAAREALLARLRSLQTGVIETDVDNIVVGANDHAEDLIGTELPSFGLPSAAENSVNAWQLFDAQAIWTLNAENGTLQATSVADIERLRLAGETTDYFVRLIPDAGKPREPQWFRVNAGPIFRPLGFPRRQRMGLIGTFGTLERASKELERRIELQQQTKEEIEREDRKMRQSREADVLNAMYSRAPMTSSEDSKHA